MILGWLEWTWLESSGVKIKTKLDTGAKTSSIDATNIKPFERNGDAWVRFTVPLSLRTEDTDRGQDLKLERRVIKIIKIKDHIRAPASRYVVNMSICINGKMIDTPVSLANRKNFNYPLLLGRSALRENILVDSSLTFIASRSCSEPD